MSSEVERQRAEIDHLQRMAAALTVERNELAAEVDRMQAERDMQIGWSDADDWLRDQHARYHDQPGNMLGANECGWDRCQFFEVAVWVRNAPSARPGDADDEGDFYADDCDDPGCTICNGTGTGCNLAEYECGCGQCHACDGTGLRSRQRVF